MSLVGIAELNGLYQNMQRERPLVRIMNNGPSAKVRMAFVDMALWASSMFASLIGLKVILFVFYCKTSFQQYKILDKISGIKDVFFHGLTSTKHIRKSTLGCGWVLL